ncbi:hypothetical protein DIPPA_12476 [Diplonema papillatum]|nr:hypothetical protein DIPPA_12476 [Diplonema papillatum]
MFWVPKKSGRFCSLTAGAYSLTHTVQGKIVAGWLQLYLEQRDNVLYSSAPGAKTKVPNKWHKLFIALGNPSFCDKLRMLRRVFTALTYPLSQLLWQLSELGSVKEAWIGIIACLCHNLTNPPLRALAFEGRKDLFGCSVPDNLKLVEGSSPPTTLKFGHLAADGNKLGRDRECGPTSYADQLKAAVKSLSSNPLPNELELEDPGTEEGVRFDEVIVKHIRSFKCLEVEKYVNAVSDAHAPPGCNANMTEKPVGIAKAVIEDCRGVGVTDDVLRAVAMFRSGNLPAVSSELLGNEKVLAYCKETYLNWETTVSRSHRLADEYEENSKQAAGEALFKKRNKKVLAEDEARAAIKELSTSDMVDNNSRACLEDQCRKRGLGRTGKMRELLESIIAFDKADFAIPADYPRRGKAAQACAEPPEPNQQQMPSVRSTKKTDRIFTNEGGEHR